MGKVVASYFTDDELIALDAWRADHGYSRYAGIQHIVRKALLDSGHARLEAKQFVTGVFSKEVSNGD